MEFLIMNFGDFHYEEISVFRVLGHNQGKQLLQKKYISKGQEMAN